MSIVALRRLIALSNLSIALSNLPIDHLTMATTATGREAMKVFQINISLYSLNACIMSSVRDITQK